MTSQSHTENKWQRYLTQSVSQSVSSGSCFLLYLPVSAKDICVCVCLCCKHICRDDPVCTCVVYVTCIATLGLAVFLCVALHVCVALLSPPALAKSCSHPHPAIG